MQYIANVLTAFSLSVPSVAYNVRTVIGIRPTAASGIYSRLVHLPADMACGTIPRLIMGLNTSIFCSSQMISGFFVCHRRDAILQQ